ncbi:MAG TPA: hypothetical protein VHV49_14250 [Pseudonocardiaceae bacterium]|nr:hypothetical protein [Pseudonocardiaceae bacterium]
MLSALVSGATLWVSVRRGSDRENRRSASVAIEVTKDETVTSIIDRERGEA